MKMMFHSCCPERKQWASDVIMAERLQKIISAAGLMSRRTAEEYISAGRVTVNGRQASLGDRADADKDRILVDGKELPSTGEKLYIMLNKPKGYVCTLSDERGRRMVTDLVAELGVRLYPVGRLDMDSEGLLLMTNDGEFANRMMHPSHEVTKTYFTWVRGGNIPGAVESLRLPMELEGYMIHPAQVELLKTLPGGALLSISIHEGRNRQVRKMCQAVGLKVTRLKRVKEGSLELGKLGPGQWRHLTHEELEMLR